MVERPGFVWRDIDRAGGPEALHESLRAAGLPADIGARLADSALRPAIQRDPEYTMLVVHGVAVGEREELSTTELDVVLGDDWLVTYRTVDVPGVDWLYDRVSSGAEKGMRSPHDVVARLYEIGAQRWHLVIQELESAADDIALAAIQGHRHVVADVASLLRDEAQIRSILRAQRTVLEELEGEEVLRPGARRSLAHARRTHETMIDDLADARTILTDALDAYRGAVADRTAEVTRLLTLYAALVLPLSLVAGIWGMNVAGLPFTDRPDGFVWVIGVMAVVGLLSWIAFHRYGFVSVRLTTKSKMLAGRIARAATVPIEKVIETVRRV